METNFKVMKIGSICICVCPFWTADEKHNYGRPKPKVNHTYTVTDIIQHNNRPYLEFAELGEMNYSDGNGFREIQPMDITELLEVLEGELV